MESHEGMVCVRVVDVNLRAGVEDVKVYFVVRMRPFRLINARPIATFP